jgi:hypothetical protein
MKENINKQINLLELIPRRNIEYETRDNELISLLTPRFRNRFLVKYLQPHLKNRYFRVDLDEIGSFVWRLCDGTRTAGEIADDMSEHFGDEIEPVMERLRLFFGQLEKLNYIEFINIEECRSRSRER